MWQGGVLLAAADPCSPPSMKKPKLEHETTRIPKSQVLPQWYASIIHNKYNYNHTMPYLRTLKQELISQIPALREQAASDVKVYRCSGIHCPVHLVSKRSLYIHSSNGVYVGFQVYIHKSVLSLYKSIYLV